MNYDTVNFKLSSQYFCDSDLDKMKYKLDKVKENDSSVYGYSVTGKCNEANIHMNGNRLIIDKTSLPKVIKGSNHLPITLEDTRLYVESISDSLHLPMDKADVTKIHFCHDYQTEDLPMRYMSTFSDFPSANKWTLDNGVYFKQNNKEQHYYDKVVELKKQHYKGLDIEGINLLRAENQFNKRINKSFPKYDMRATALWNPEFYNYQVKLLTGNYFKINKRRKEFMKLNPPETVKDYFKMLEMIGASVVGESDLKLLVEDWFKKGQIDYYIKYRILKGIKERYDFREYDSIDLLLELDEKVRQSAKDYLL
jgi:hypothetical protein